MKSAFQSYLVLKEQSKKKLKSLAYNSFGIQQYTISEKFSLKQIRLFYFLRSKCHPAKMNFKKTNVYFFAIKKIHKTIFLKHVQLLDRNWIPFIEMSLKTLKPFMFLRKLMT